MKNNTGKGMAILKAALSVILFSLFLKFDSILQVINTFVEWGWSLLPIIFTSVLIRMVLAGIVVLIILPNVLGCKNWRTWLPRYLMADGKIVLMGIFSFVIFTTLATVISLLIGIFKGNISAVFTFPDIRPDPDVIGWGYFLLALVPGIWEELAFRGLIQSKFRMTFSTRVSVFLSSIFFGFFHFSNIITQTPSQVIFGAIMAFFFGLGWGYVTVRAGSVVPAMISHYLVDSMGQIFLGVDRTNPALTTGFFLSLTLLFPIFNILLAKLMYPSNLNDMNSKKGDSTVLPNPV